MVFVTRENGEQGTWDYGWGIPPCHKDGRAWADVAYLHADERELSFILEVFPGIEKYAVIDKEGYYIWKGKTAQYIYLNLA